MGIEWLRPGAFFGSILYALIGVVDLLAELRASSTSSRPTTCGRRSSKSRTWRWPSWSGRDGAGHLIIVAAAAIAWSRDAGRHARAGRAGAAAGRGRAARLGVRGRGLRAGVRAGRRRARARMCWATRCCSSPPSSAPTCSRWASAPGCRASSSASCPRTSCASNCWWRWSAARCRRCCSSPTPACPAPSACCCTGWCWLVGTLVGLEIPLVMRILKRNVALKDLVSQVLTFDYLGALAVSVAFPLLLVPQLGLVRTGLLFGLMNAAVALWALWLFRHELRRLRRARAGLRADARCCWARRSPAPTASRRWPRTRFYQDPSCSPRPRPTSASSSRAAAPGIGCSSTATCSSPSATSTAITRRWCIPRWPRTARRARWRCSAAATAWRCARCCATRRSRASRWSSSIRT